MELISQPIASRVSLVHVHDLRVRWSVRASQVLRIVTATEWVAGPALDVVASLGGYPSASGSEVRRVLVVRGAGDQEIALLATGPIDIGDVDPGDVLALPAAFTETASHIAGIIVAPDTSLSLLLEPSAVTRPEDSVFGEEICPRHS